jgi:DUF917 family protein
VANRILRAKTVRLVPLADVPDRAKVVSVAGMGSPQAMLRTPFTTEARQAFDALSREAAPGTRYVIPLETSGFNFLTPMTVAASRAVSVIDADAAGRAIPQLNQTLFFSRKVPLAPLALADAKGRSIVIRTEEYALGEKAAISALEYFGWSAGLACYPMIGRTAKRAAVAGTISLARAVGRAVRRATLSKTDPLQALLSVTGGWELLRGTVDRFESETVGSYTFGNVEVAGKGTEAGARLRVKSINENMIAWKNGRLAAVAPDRICFLRPDGRAITNADLAHGDEIAVFVIEAQQNWRTKGATALFTPTLSAMGYKGPFVPAGRLRAS